MPRNNFVACTCAIIIMIMGLGCSDAPVVSEGTDAPVEAQTRNDTSNQGTGQETATGETTTVVGVVLEANRPLGFRMEILQGGHEISESATDVVVTDDTNAKCQSGGAFVLETGMEVDVTYDMLLDSDPPKIPAVSVTADC